MKFGAFPKGIDPDTLDEAALTPYSYPGTFLRQSVRVVVASSSGHIDLALRVLAHLTPEFAIRYVLVIPRSEKAEAGRYQLARTLNMKELSVFMDRYRRFFEEDGRHDIWVRSIPDEAMVVYDRHQLLYFFGSDPILDRFETILAKQGLSAGEVEIPYPHFHNYKEEFDADENSLIKSEEFTRTPLQESDTE